MSHYNYDWFFYHRISKFMEAFYVDILGAKDYWYRFEWQHRGSPRDHGLAWLSEAPAVEQILASNDDENLIDAAEEIVTYVDSIVCTTNPAIAADGSNAESAPIPKTNPHISSPHTPQIFYG